MPCIVDIFSNSNTSGLVRIIKICRRLLIIHYGQEFLSSQGFTQPLYQQRIGSGIHRRKAFHAIASIAVPEVNAVDTICLHKPFGRSHEIRYLLVSEITETDTLATSFNANTYLASAFLDRGDTLGIVFKDITQITTRCNRHFACGLIVVDGCSS